MSLIYNAEQTLLPTLDPIAQLYSVPDALVLAHIKQESNFDANAYRAEPAINDASYGLMQVLLSTAKTIDKNATADALYDPAYNMSIGIQYIAKNLNRYNGNVQDAIAAYNAGSAMKNADGDYVNSQGVTNVQDYVDKVYSNYQNYTDWIANGAQMIDPGATMSDLGSAIVNNADYSVAIGLGIIITAVMVTQWRRPARA